MWEAKAREAQSGARAGYERHLRTLREQREAFEKAAAHFPRK